MTTRETLDYFNMGALKLSSCLLLVLLVSTKAELFTALVDLEKLLYTEGEIIRTLEQYLNIEEERLQKVRWIRGEYDKLYRRASTDVQTFLSNPVNAYLLVKRLTADWKVAEDLIQGYDSKALIENITHNRQDLQFPDDEDLNGAAAALMRLQDTYKLETAALARGHIEGTKPSTELSAGDCYELGRQAYNSADYYHTLLWMQEALDRIDEEDNKTAEKAEILEYIAYSTYMQGNVRHALKLTTDLLELMPDHPRAEGNLRYYKDALVRIEARKRGDDGDIPYEPDALTANIPTPAVTYTVPERENYERLCRGEKLQKDGQHGRILGALTHKAFSNENKLLCRLITNNNPYLLLQPVKEEELSLKPRIVIYYDVLSNHEMNVIKALAQPKLQRATVQNSQSGELETASYRISKSAWLKNEDHSVVSRVSQRIEAITGLYMATAEELQVVNYGIGGHYEPHYDFARKEETNAFKSLGTGNRIATWLNYMSDVDAGGATVFPSIGVSVKPKKGSAAFWYNLFRNGDGDMETRHAACPVLAGSKWVSNKWIHERGQEFRRTCSLNEFE